MEQQFIKQNQPLTTVVYIVGVKPVGRSESIETLQFGIVLLDKQDPTKTRGTNVYLIKSEHRKRKKGVLKGHHHKTETRTELGTNFQTDQRLLFGFGPTKKVRPLDYIIKVGESYDSHSTIKDNIRAVYNKWKGTMVCDSSGYFTMIALSSIDKDYWENLVIKTKQGNKQTGLDQEIINLDAKRQTLPVLNNIFNAVQSKSVQTVKKTQVYEQKQPDNNNNNNNSQSFSLVQNFLNLNMSTNDQSSQPMPSYHNDSMNKGNFYEQKQPNNNNNDNNNQPFYFNAYQKPQNNNQSNEKTRLQLLKKIDEKQKTAQKYKQQGDAYYEQEKKCKEMGDESLIKFQKCLEEASELRKQLSKMQAKGGVNNDGNNNQPGSSKEQILQDHKLAMKIQASDNPMKSQAFSFENAPVDNEPFYWDYQGDQQQQEKPENFDKEEGYNSSN